MPGASRREEFDEIIKGQGFGDLENPWEDLGLGEALPHIASHPELRGLAIFLRSDHQGVNLAPSPEKAAFDTIFPEKDGYMTGARWEVFNALCVRGAPEHFLSETHRANTHNSRVIGQYALFLSQTEEDLDYSSLTYRQAGQLVRLANQTVLYLLEAGRDLEMTGRPHDRTA